MPSVEISIRHTSCTMHKELPPQCLRTHLDHDRLAAPRPAIHAEESFIPISSSPSTLYRVIAQLGSDASTPLSRRRGGASIAVSMYPRCVPRATRLAPLRKLVTFADVYARCSAAARSVCVWTPSLTARTPAVLALVDSACTSSATAAGPSV